MSYSEIIPDFYGDDTVCKECGVDDYYHADECSIFHPGVTDEEYEVLLDESQEEV